MIDRIRIYREIDLDTSKFSEKFKYEYIKVEPKIDIETGKILREGYTIDRYIYKHNALAIIYSMTTGRLYVLGRLPNISTAKDLVHNLDDFIVGVPKLDRLNIKSVERTANELCAEAVYNVDDELEFQDQFEEEVEEEYVYEDLNSIIKKVNDKIHGLTGVRGLNIIDFSIASIEVSFNIFNVENVDRYIELFNLIFKDKNDKRYKNYALENNKELYSSFYVKSNLNYKNNTNNSYTINFYNKLNQLEYLDKKTKNNSKVIKVTNRDKRLAEDVLRLEVKLGYESLKKTSKKFKEFLDINFCEKIITEKYKYFISKDDELLDFYSYKKAKDIIINTDDLDGLDKKNLLNYIEKKFKCNKNFSYQTERKYKKMLGKLGLHYHFIPTRWGIDYLESPISMLHKKVENIKKKSGERWKLEIDKINTYQKQKDIKNAIEEELPF